MLNRLTFRILDTTMDQECPCLGMAKIYSIYTPHGMERVPGIARFPGMIPVTGMAGIIMAAMALISRTALTIFRILETTLMDHHPRKCYSINSLGITRTTLTAPINFRILDTLE